MRVGRSAGPRLLPSALSGADHGLRSRAPITEGRAVGLLGALLGTVAGCIAMVASSGSNSLDGLSSLSNVPARNLLVITVGMPLMAGAAGWFLAGREPAVMTHQPLE